ncbi:uncharacterized protein [Coffea arabica]|uniref:Reverse transcriptase zinc-binding domain-containing protein n=1 Tax=Coffea arabica TaxID=13443 RepID=A0A6P6WSP6_COFAR|nr:uncharacterized protein LOC113735649 [Coffea arabica]
MAVPSRDVPDAMTWVVSTSGRFSLFSTFQEIWGARDSSFMSKQCWHTQVPLKISFFMLRLFRGRLPLDDVLTKFQFHMPSKCFCCMDSQAETVKHLILEGELAMAVLKFFGSSCGIRYAGDHLLVVLANWLYKPAKSKRLKFIFRLLPIFVCWNLWKARNIAFYQGVFVDFHSVIVDSDSMVLVRILNDYYQCPWSIRSEVEQDFELPRGGFQLHSSIVIGRLIRWQICC